MLSVRVWVSRFSRISLDENNSIFCEPAVNFKKLMGLYNKYKACFYLHSDSRVVGDCFFVHMLVSLTTS